MTMVCITWDELKPVQMASEKAMAAGWSGCMSGAIRSEEARVLFEKSTGNVWPDGNPLTDQGGAEIRQYSEAFLVWATRAIWRTWAGVPARILAQMGGAP